MKSTFRPLRSNNNLLVTLFVAVSALIMVHGFLLCAEPNEESGYSQCNMCGGNTRAVDEKDLHFSSTGFTVANQLGKIENMDRSFCSTQESEKVIRSSITDKERIFVLSFDPNMVYPFQVSVESSALLASVYSDSTPETHHLTVYF